MESSHSAEDIVKGIGSFSMSTYPTARFFLHFTGLGYAISQAYGIDMQYIQHDAEWIDSQLYDIDAEVEGGKPLTQEQMEPLLQNLLQQRFHLRAHRETKTVSGFLLVIAKDGEKLQPTKEGTQAGGMLLPDRLDASAISTEALAGILKRRAGKPVVDKTGLTGSYDIHLSFAPFNDPNSALPDLFTAIQEQLGLKLEPAKVPVDTLVIDHVDRVPTEN